MDGFPSNDLIECIVLEKAGLLQFDEHYKTEDYHAASNIIDELIEQDWGQKIESIDDVIVDGKVDNFFLEVASDSFSRKFDVRARNIETADYSRRQREIYLKNKG